jgi:large subunit ribosomal protein L21
LTGSCIFGRIKCLVQIGRPKIYAIVETGGKQYKVTEGQTIEVERLEAEEGGSVQLDKVLLLSEGDNITVGKPLVEGARVMATVKKNGRSKKIIVFHYKAKVRERRKNGHRQQFTSLNIDKILPAGAEYVKPVKKATRRKKTEEKAENGA